MHATAPAPRPCAAASRPSIRAPAGGASADLHAASRETFRQTLLMCTQGSRVIGMSCAPSSVGGLASEVRRSLTDAGVAAHEIDLLTHVVTGHVEPYVDEMPFFLVLHAVRMAGQKLRDRAPWASPDDICRRALSQSTWRSLSRSLNRSVANVPEIGRWGDWQRVSSNWRHGMCDAIVKAAQMGAGATPSHRRARRDAGHDGDATSPAPSLDFTCADFQIPPGTQSHQRFRLIGKGIKRLQSPGTGDHYVHVKIKIPTYVLFLSIIILKTYIFFI